MYETFKSIREKNHTHLDLCLNAEAIKMAGGNPHIIREGIEFLFGKVGAAQGIQVGPFCSVKAQQLPLYSIMLGDKLVFGGNDQANDQELSRLTLLLKLAPTQLFGVEQAVIWMEMANHHYPDLVERARMALNDPSGYVRFATLLTRLVEERVPVTDEKTILATIAANELIGHGESAIWAVVEQIRSAVRESAAAYYKKYLIEDDVFRADSDFLAALHKPETVGTVRQMIKAYLGDLRASAVIIASSDCRRALWGITETMFESGELARPVLVLKPEEVPVENALPPSRSVIRISPLPDIS